MRWQVVLVTAAVALGAARDADAVTIRVTTTADLPADGRRCVVAGEPCSLRAAIQVINASPSPDGTDVVDLPAGIYELALGGAHEGGGATGDLDIRASFSLIGAGVPRGFCISGRGPFVPPDLPFPGGCTSADEGTLIDANGLDRAIEVHRGATVRLSHLAVTGGIAPQFPGSDLPSEGGGIRNSGELALIDVAVTESRAGVGGGLHSNRTVGTFNSTIAFNQSTDSSLATSCGGGIAITAGTAYINATFVSGNEAALAGGGICISSFEPPFRSESGQLNLTMSTISNNRARTGGGVAVRQRRTVPGAIAARVEDTTIIGNVTSLDGGGLWIGRDDDVADDIGVTLFGVFVVSNQASGQRGRDGRITTASGGGIFSRAGLSVAYSAVRSNTVRSGNGGGLFLEGTLDRPVSALINRSEVSLNRAEGIDARFGRGAGIHASRAHLEATNVTFSTNLAEFMGGALRADESVTLLDRVTVVDNRGGPGPSGLDVAGGSITSSLTLIGRGGGGANCRVPGGFTSGDFLDGFFLTAFNVEDRRDCGFVTVTDVGVGALQNNGGPTWTRGLNLGSPALDLATPTEPGPGAPQACPAERNALVFGIVRPTRDSAVADQRGVDRPQRSLCDAGAYERAWALPSWFGCCFVEFLRTLFATSAVTATSAEYHATLSRMQDPNGAPLAKQLLDDALGLEKLLRALPAVQDEQQGAAALAPAGQLLGDVGQNLTLLEACCSAVLEVDAQRRFLSDRAQRAHDAFLALAASVRHPELARALDRLLDDVRAADLPSGLQSALAAKLDAARASMVRAAPQSLRAQISAFLNQLDAVAGKQVPEKTAAAWREAAKEILRQAANMS
jgi:hypothetical protein